MYRFDAFDRQLVRERIDQFRDQLQRYLAGALSDEAFLPLRLQIWPLYHPAKTDAHPRSHPTHL